MPRRRWFTLGILLIASFVLCYYFPLIHVRPLGESAILASRSAASNLQNSKIRDPVTYAEELWNGRMRREEGLLEITQLWQAYDADAEKVTQEYGRQIGLGGAAYFCVRGRGKIDAIEKNRCTVIVPGEPHQARLEIGVLVDNTVREAIGVNVNDFVNSQSFNAVSTELNRRVEEEVIEPIKDKLKVGAVVEFVGCTKIGRKSDLNPLCLVPIHLEMEDPGTAE